MSIFKDMSDADRARLCGYARDLGYTDLQEYEKTCVARLNAQKERRILEMQNIKKNGSLIALNNCGDGVHGWQYWLYNGVVYSVSASGDHFAIYCTVERFGSHCARLFQVCGYKPFTEAPGVVVVNSEFIKRFPLA